MQPVHLIIEPRTPTDSTCSDVPYAIQVASPGPYADRDASGVRVGAWGTGLFSCFQHLVPNCCMATFCPCVSLAQIAARLDVFRFKSVLCGLISVAIVQLVSAFITFAQVHSNDASARFSRDNVHARSWDQYRPRSVLAMIYGGTDDDDDDSSDDSITRSAGGSAFAADMRDMAASPWGVLCVLLCLVHVVVAWRLRMKIRERFAIRGACAFDLLVSLLLPCCNIAQMATHVKSYKPRECRFGPPDVLPAYPSLCKPNDVP